MSLLSDAKATVSKFLLNMGRFDQIMNASDQTDISLDNGNIPSLRKLFKQFADRFDGTFAGDQVVLATRSAFSSLSKSPNRVLLLGFSATGDQGANAVYVKGISNGPMAIQNQLGIWYNLDISPAIQEFGWWGIIGNRVADDTNALKNAIFWLQGKGKSLTGSNLIIRITSQINIDDTIRFFGGGYRHLPKYTADNSAPISDTDLNKYIGLVFYIDFLITTPFTENEGLGNSNDWNTAYAGQCAAFFVRGQGVIFDDLEFQCNQNAIPSSPGYTQSVVSMANSNNLTFVPNTSSYQINWSVYGPGIPDGTRIQSIGASNVVLTNPVQYSSNALTVTFTPPWAPTEQAWAIRTLGRPYFSDAFGLKIRNVMLRNLTYGIGLYGCPQSIIQNVKGQCMKKMLVSTATADICNIDTLWNGWTYWTGHSSIFEWQSRNAVGLTIGRFDGGLIKDIFTFYNAVTIKFFHSSENGAPIPTQAGGSTRTRIIGLYCDGSIFGILGADTCSFDVIGMTYYGRYTNGNCTAVLITDTKGFPQPNRITICNANFQSCNGSVIQTQRKSIIELSNIEILSYNVPPHYLAGQSYANQPSGPGASAFNINTDGVLRISNLHIDANDFAADNGNPYGNFTNGQLFSTTGNIFLDTSTKVN